jgi:8-oxo-dGTP diphosphatase
MRAVANSKIFLSNQYGELLLLRRAPLTSRPGRWDLPGGIVEPYEDPAETVLRETFEETGLRLGKSALKFVFAETIAESDNELNVTRFFYKGRVDDMSPVAIKLSTEHREHGWFSYDEAAEHLTHPPQFRALQFIMRTAVS